MQVLDHGSIDLVESWGSDERIIEAARMSTAKGFLGWDAGRCPVCGGAGSTKGVGLQVVLDVSCIACEGKGTIAGDAKLLARLWKMNHATPFEMAGAIVEVQAPIFVFREWHRHRTQSYNEMSARYVPLPDINYLPTVERLMINSKTNKQAGVVAGSSELTESSAVEYLGLLERQYQQQQWLYEAALSRGVPKELARLHLPVGRYSRMRASANLRNWLAFLSLRLDPAAQWEIRQYAKAVHGILAERFPRTLALFDEGRAP